MHASVALGANLSNGEIGYYTAVATAIPVLLVAYVVGVRDFVAESIVPRAEKIAGNQSRRLFESARDVRSLPKAFRALSSPIVATLYQALVLAVFVAAALLPALGEAAALAALFGGSPNTELRTLSEIGIIAAGAVVLFPLGIHVIRAFLFSTPTYGYIGIGSGILLTPLLVALMLASRKLFGLPVIDRDVRLVYVEHDGLRSYRGLDSFKEFCALAWGGERQHPGGLLWINERSVLVTDRTADPPARIGATRYERRGFKIVRLIAYADAEDARVALAQERDARLGL
jgi:hypothetical protein